MFDAPLGFDEEDSEKEEHSERGSGEGVGGAMGIVAGDVVDGEVGIGEGESNPPVVVG